MAERTPLYMDINNVYSGDEMGLPNRDFVSEGIVATADMAVSAGAGNTINIAAGAAWVVGDTDVVNQPTYRIINDAVVNLGINPDPTNPRQIRVGMQINDAGFSGVLRNGVLTAIHGTPGVGPVIPAEPASFLTLATILVPAAAASSAAYTFTDVRPRARIGGGGALPSLKSTAVLSKSVDQSIPNATFTVVPFDVEISDPANLHDNVTNNTRIGLDNPGLWMVGWSTLWANVVGGSRLGMVRVTGGSDYAKSIVARDLSFGTTPFTASTIVLVGGAGNYVEFFVYQDSGGAVNLTSGLTGARFWATFLG